MDLKFSVLMFKEIRERLESFRMRNRKKTICKIQCFCCSHLTGRKKYVVFLYIWKQKFQLCEIFLIQKTKRKLLRESSKPCNQHKEQERPYRESQQPMCGEPITQTNPRIKHALIPTCKTRSWIPQSNQTTAYLSILRS